MGYSEYGLVDQYLANSHTAHLEELKEFLSVPSVSALSQHRSDVRKAADMLAHKMASIGLRQVKVMETGGHPVVYGEWLGAPGRLTALVYGHYDVQPVDPLNLWQTPPFKPTVRNGKIYARGASDDKGQVWLQVLAAEAFLKTGNSLPVNLKFLFEGEEEIGSCHLHEFVENHRDMLAADVVVISDSTMLEPGLPTICYGLRGLATLEIHVSGPKSDLHSGLFGGSVANPLHALAELVASLHDSEGRVNVPGFYEDVQPLFREESEAYARIPFDEIGYREELGVPALFGEPGYTVLERIWARPTLEVNGMWGGFQGEGTKTIIPSEANAKISCRLVPNQDPGKVLQAIVRHLKGVCPPGIRLEVDVQGGTPAVMTPIDSEYVRAAAWALRTAFDQEACFVRNGGTIGIAPTFTRALNAPLILMGFGLPNENFHAPNEHFDLNNFQRGQRAVAAYWIELGNSHTVPLQRYHREDV